MIWQRMLNQNHITMATNRPTRTTAYTIMGEIGNETLFNFIHNVLPARKFTSHDFTMLFPVHFPNEYERMLDAYVEYGETPYRNQKITNAIGKYLGNHRQSLHIEKIGTAKSKNINGTVSSASVWHKVL